MAAPSRDNLDQRRRVLEHQAKMARTSDHGSADPQRKIPLIIEVTASGGSKPKRPKKRAAKPVQPGFEGL
jgi:hypothetical protein